MGSQTDAESAFLVASLLGFIAVLASTAVLWLRVGREPASSDPSGQAE